MKKEIKPAVIKAKEIKTFGDSDTIQTQSQFDC